MTIYPNLIIEALKNVRYPGTGMSPSRYYSRNRMIRLSAP